MLCLPCFPPPSTYAVTLASVLVQSSKDHGVKEVIPYTLTVHNPSAKKFWFYTLWLFLWFPFPHHLSHSPPETPSWGTCQKT